MAEAWFESGDYFDSDYFDSEDSAGDYDSESSWHSGGSSFDEETERQPNSAGSTEAKFDPIIYAKNPVDHPPLMFKQSVRDIARTLVGFTDNPIDVSSANFCVEDTLSRNDIQICVKKIGNLKFPITVSTVNKLKHLSTKAIHGVGSETVIDKKFQNAHMISPLDLNVKINKLSLAAILQRMQVSLGLSKDKKLNASLRNLLIYEEGQFLDRQQDFEKIPNMVATLVIVLPSPHIGGGLVVEHGQKKYEVATENLNDINPKCICFYSDCWHTVEKVKKGNRVVLTYNIALEGVTGDLQPVKVAVQQYFDSGRDTKKLVFLLNHNYSKDSLKWDLLKEEDRGIALRFLSIAKSLNLTINLTLVQITQSWVCKNSEEFISTGGMENFDEKHKIKFWVDVNNIVLPYDHFRPHCSEVCFIKETFYKNFKPQGVVDVVPPKEELFCRHVMRNYWYQRAALVMFKTKNTEKIMPRLNSAGVMQQLSNLIKSADNEEKVKRILNFAGRDLVFRFTASNTRKKYLYDSYTSSSPFNDSVDIALYVKDEDAASIALTGYTGSILNQENIPLILAIQKQYGVEFLTQILEDWLYLGGEILILMPFVAGFIKAGGAKTAVQLIIKHKINRFKCTDTPNSIDQLLDIFKACYEAGDTKSQELFANKLITSENFRSKSELVDVYLILKDLNSKGFTPFLLILSESIKDDIKNMQSEGLWYMDKNYCSSCSCDECKPVYSFMKSNEQSLTIPGNCILHLQSKFHSKPFTLSILGKGRSAVIMINKNESVYQNNEKKFKKLSGLLQKLGQTASKREFVSKKNTDDAKKKK